MWYVVRGLTKLLSLRVSSILDSKCGFVVSKTTHSTHIFPVKSNGTSSSGPCNCNRLFLAFSIVYPAEASLAPVKASVSYVGM